MRAPADGAERTGPGTALAAPVVGAAVAGEAVAGVLTVLTAGGGRWATGGGR